MVLCCPTYSLLVLAIAVLAVNGPRRIMPIAESFDIAVRNLPGLSSGDTLREIRRRLDIRANSSNNTVLFDKSTTLDAALDDKTLFEYKNDDVTHRRRDGTEVSASIEIKCTKCYIRGVARAKLTAAEPFNGSEIIEDVKNATKTTFNSITDYWDNITTVVEDNWKDWTPDEIITEIEQMPPPQVDLNVDLEFPGYQLQVAFVNTELYVELSTILSSGLSYSLTLYSSTQLGAQVGKKLFLGVVFSVDLLLSVESEIEISSGFHMKLDDEVLMTIALFSKEASDFEFKGGRFRFLPVTIQSGSTLLRAVLRLQLRAGFSMMTFSPGFNARIGNFSSEDLTASAGVEALVYANVAEFVTNVTSQAPGIGSKPGCVLKVVQDYKLAIGAAAGATLGFLGTTYGPTPATEIPIFYTTLGSACLTKNSITTGSTSPISSQAVRRDNDEPSTTTVTKVIYTATACMSLGMANCPASLQTVSKNTVTKTLSAAVVSGSDVVWSTAAVTALVTVPFPKGAMSLTGSSGAPKSYVPPPPTISSASPTGLSGILGGESGGGSNKLIIGLSVGLGLPVLLATIVGIIYFAVKHRRSSGLPSCTMPGDAEPPADQSTKHQPTSDKDEGCAS
ncbi:hypothetical protein Purlil1_12397 [Purpureocillium lilacinum]|uniref:Mid2 domain-containing protein n=1 Tax=Purpureocillium lilacinum TaxID=33203 RepID=A0ABR0BI34_PURLI|nr:hypothetical protein Purlil1_12397 [Purpureocillium lilacinum]